MDDAVVVGLGNPGSAYENTRHNVGFEVVDELARRWKKRFRAGKGEFLYTRAQMGGNRVVLLKPLTYMNNSGLAVEDALTQFGGSAEDLIVVVDDVALPLGKLRIRLGGSDGGHNGLASIIYSLTTDSFLRLRCGIGEENPVSGEQMSAYVLSPFEGAEGDQVTQMVEKAADAVQSLLIHGVEKTMNHFNR